MWELFGEKLGVDVHTLDRMQVVFNHNITYSPSKAMLMEWQHTQHATLDALVEILKIINNATAVEIVSLATEARSAKKART